MSAIRSRGRRGHTVVPNWRWEDTDLSDSELRIAGWLASHADGYVEEHVSRNEIARRTGVSSRQVSRCLVSLEEKGIVAVSLSGAVLNGRLLITFDWSAWETQVGHHAPPTGAPRPTDRGTTPHLADSHLYTGETQGEEQTEARLASAEFDVFWWRYPNKVGKPAARRSWVTALKKAPANVILNGVGRWATHWEKAGTAQQFIPHPSTWLNQERWNDACPALVAPVLTKSERSMAAIERLAARGNKPALSLEEAFREMNP